MYVRNRINRINFNLSKENYMPLLCQTAHKKQICEVNSKFLGLSLNEYFLNILFVISDKNFDFQTNV